MAERPYLDQLRIKIESLRVKTFGKRYFIDPKELDGLLSGEVVRTAVKECLVPEHRRKRIAEIILTKSKLTFAILVRMQREDLIPHFLDHGEFDSSLPQSKERILEISPALENGFTEEVQWEFLPHYFERDTRRIVRPETVLPIVHEQQLADERGAFGTISRITITSTMQDLLQNGVGTVCAIRKQLRPTRDAAVLQRKFDNERECLEILYQLQHSNIVELLCSYTINEQHCLLFPCLDMDLRDLFRRNDRFGEFNENMTFYMNLQGLASALERVHNLRLGSEHHQFELARIGYHHDICPRNILVSEQKLLLTDFGLAAMKPLDENSQTEWKSGMGDYIAPESMAADLTHQKVGRKLDIWSFGCLTTDIIAYIDRGPTGVEMASDQRLGPSTAGGWRNSYFHTADSVKPKFLSWMRELCEESVHEELSCFLDEAIHVLQISPVDRPSAEEVRKDMAFLALKALFVKAQVTVTTYYLDLEARDVPGLPLVDVWFEKERLNSWGSVLEISTRSSRSEFFDGAELLATNQHIYPCQEILLRLIQQFGGLDYSSSTRTSVTHFIQRNATLRDLVKSLGSQLPDPYLKRIDAIWKRMLTRTDKLDELQTRGKAGNQEQYKEAAALASMKALRLALSNEIELGNHDDLLLLDANNLRLDRKSTGQRTGFYDDKSETREAGDGTHYHGQVLAEIMTYNPAWDRQTPEEKITKIGALAALLHHTPKPQGFRVLDCLGFLDLGESNGFTLLFTFPYSTHYSRHTTQSLSETLSLQYQPSLQDRILLAQVIASSLYELHNAGWLHKAICSDNILFFREDNLRSQAKIREPYLVNFRHSRPDGTVWVSEGPGEHLEYYHPEYLAKGDGGGFKKIYDYYSVGLVLLEIGFWKPLSDFSSQHKKTSQGTFRRILLDKYVPKLDRYMGGLYREAVRTCLEDTGLGDDDDVWLPGFYKKVVEPLMSIKV